MRYDIGRYFQVLKVKSIIPATEEVKSLTSLSAKLGWRGISSELVIKFTSGHMSSLAHKICQRYFKKHWHQPSGSFSGCSHRAQSSALLGT